MHFRRFRNIILMRPSIRHLHVASSFLGEVHAPSFHLGFGCCRLVLSITSGNTHTVVQSHAWAS
jgi:hypothetical protein